MEYHGMKIDHLYDFETSTFPGEEALTGKKNRTVWNPILNYFKDKLDHLDQDSRPSHPISTNEFLIFQKKNMWHTEERLYNACFSGPPSVASGLTEGYPISYVSPDLVVAVYQPVTSLCLRSLITTLSIASNAIQVSSFRKPWQKLHHYGYVQDAKRLSTTLTWLRRIKEVF